MFINDVHRKEEIRAIAVQHLKKYGVKYRPKKARAPQQVARHGKKFFKVPLQNLETETVTLPNGQQLIIPKRIHEMCSYILSKVETEGIFRKEGSKSRQHEIKLSLDRGCSLGNDHHVIDVAVVLKCFLRELPEPLIPPTHNELFLMCTLGKRSREDTIQCILLACLLLPSENLIVLSYLMQFFSDVASFSKYNKMNVSNLSILVGPNIFPIDEKLVPKSSLTITRICDISRLLIENSKAIGFIPDYIIEQIGQVSETELEKKKKNKRRSGSLTRVFNGLKKIVSNKTEEEPKTVTPDILTPNIHNSMKKRKETGLSLKRKKEVVSKLPDCALLNNPFTPIRTPVSINPNGKKNSQQRDSGEFDSLKEKKMHWYMRSRSMKSLKEDDSVASSSHRNSLGPKSLLERRWSAVSSAANFRKKKRVSCSLSKKQADEPDYVRVPKTEFEEFKNRVSAIERRISLELDNIEGDIENDNNVNRELAAEAQGSIENVQTAYRKTLETAALCPTTDQLARRLSRDLRIRRSGEQQIIRSPSARKIGTLRRRSTEREKKSVQIVRNQSWHFGVSATANCQAPLLPRVSVRRKKRLSKENAPVINMEPEVTREASLNTQNRKQGTLYQKNAVLRQPHLRQSSTGNSHYSRETSCEQWVSAEGFFTGSTQTLESSGGDARASIAKLRSQNVGMVRAKARLFDRLKEADSSSEMQQDSSSAKESKDNPIRMSSRRSKNASVSPRRRKNVTCASQKQRLQLLGRQYVKKELSLSTPRKDLEAAVSSPRRTPRLNTPYIKSPLTVKTPKRLCRTPVVDKRTPFRVLATPM